MKPYAALSVDVDTVATHLQGYGYWGIRDDGLVYERALPRMLDLFGALGIRATFFVVVEDALRYPDLIRELMHQGHEVACHSLTHPFKISQLNESHLYDEIVYARSVLSQLTGQPVLGFRSPSWQLSERLMGMIAEAGYWYDATAYPSPLLLLAQFEIARRGQKGTPREWRKLWNQAFGQRMPYLVRTDRGDFLELPVSTLTPLRIPFYHTLRWMLPRILWRWMCGELRQTGYVTYVFHAVDFLGADTDPIDRRLLPHPGMRLPLQYKLQEARRVLTEELGAYRIVPLSELPTVQLSRIREQLRAEAMA
jgi:hypothetical protein